MGFNLGGLGSLMGSVAQGMQNNYQEAQRKDEIDYQEAQRKDEIDYQRKMQERNDMNTELASTIKLVTTGGFGNDKLPDGRPDPDFQLKMAGLASYFEDKYPEFKNHPIYMPMKHWLKSSPPTPAQTPNLTIPTGGQPQQPNLGALVTNARATLGSTPAAQSPNLGALVTNARAGLNFTPTPPLPHVEFNTPGETTYEKQSIFNMLRPEESAATINAKERAYAAAETDKTSNNIAFGNRLEKVATEWKGFEGTPERNEALQALADATNPKELSVVESKYRKFFTGLNAKDKAAAVVAGQRLAVVRNSSDFHNAVLSIKPQDDASATALAEIMLKNYNEGNPLMQGVSDAIDSGTIKTGANTKNQNDTNDRGNRALDSRERANQSLIASRTAHQALENKRETRLGKASGKNGKPMTPKELKADILRYQKDALANRSKLRNAMATFSPEDEAAIQGYITQDESRMAEAQAQLDKLGGGQGGGQGAYIPQSKTRFNGRDKVNDVSQALDAGYTVDQIIKMRPQWHPDAIKNVYQDWKKKHQ